MKQAGLIILLLALLFRGPMFLLGATLAKEGDTWTPERSLAIKSIDSLDLSPDLQWILYSVTGVVAEQDYASITRLWLARGDGSEARPLTGTKDSISSPAWSPDGKRVACLSRRGGHNDIWLLDPFAPGDAWPLTGLTMGATSFKWSPDGKRIAFLMADAPSKEMMASMAAKGSPKIVGQDKVSINLYTVEVPADRQIAQPRRLTAAGFVISGFTWSPDGRTIAFSHQPSADYDAIFDNDISQVSTEGGSVQPLIRQPGWDLQPAYSPDGKWILFSSARGDSDKSVHRYHNDFALIPAGGGPVRYLASSWSQSPGFVKWRKDGTGLYYGESHGTVSRICFLPVDGSPPVPIYDPRKGVIGAVDISDDGRLLVFTQEFMDRPVEIYERIGDASPRLASGVNTFASAIKYAPSELITWKSKDGTAIEGLLTYPLNYQKGKRYPLLLSAHAGLYHHSQNHTARFTGYPLQTLAAEGYMILRPNPRGSNDQTLAFREAIAPDWSGITYADNISGVDFLIRSGLADPDRLGVFGWSTGGFMTAWIVAKTDRFKAASIGAAPVDLVSFTNTSDSTEWLPAFFKKEVWQDDRPYREQSSLFHMKRPTTPCLLMWGDSDVRVPIGQGWELYNTLKRQGCEVEFVIYPRSGHVPADPRSMMDIAARNLAWFKKYIPTEKGSSNGRGAGSGMR